MPALVLFQPPGTCRTFTRSGSVYPPLGLCQLAAMVPPDQAEVVDADGLDLDEEAALAAVLRLEPRVVGMTVTTATVSLVGRWAETFAARGLRVIAGGPQASLRPSQLLAACPALEAAVRGEAEPVVEELCEAARTGAPFAGIEGVQTRGGPTATIQKVAELQALPFPRYEGLPIGAYQCPDARRRPMVTVMSSRGCPHACAFCSSSFLLGKKIRTWGVEQVLDHLEALKEDQGVAELSFVDDVFTIQRRRLLALCGGMVERRLDLSWFCNARADQVDGEVAEALARAGCHQVYLGFESGDQGILDRVNKGASLARLEEGAAHLRAAGVNRSVGFVLGLPGETDQTVEASIRLAWRLQPERLQFTGFTALPGTPLARDEVDPARSFHSSRQGGEADRVQAWVERAYQACAGQVWGQRSW